MTLEAARARYLLAPGWVPVLVSGATLAVGAVGGVLAAAAVHPGAVSVGVVVALVLVTVAVQAVVAPWAAARATRLRYPLLALVDRPADVVAAARAVRRGPVPQDPDVRAAAHARAVEALGQQPRPGWRLVGPVLLAVGILLSSRGAWWSWAVVGGYAILALRTEVSLRRLARRVPQLAAPPDQPRSSPRR